MTDGPGFFYDRQGQPMTSDQWNLAVNDLDTRRVAQDDILTPGGRALWISTVWLGLDVYLHRDGPPLIFETMVLERNLDEVDGQRYATEAAAIAGHRAMVHAAREGLMDP